MPLSSIRKAYQTGLGHLYPPEEISALFKLSLTHATGSALPFQTPTPTQQQALDHILEELITGKPIQHILGSTTFLGHKFITGPSALIPRPETEELVLHAFNFASGLPCTPVILDVGTGTGCIAISLKRLLPQAVVTGIDVSAGALGLARLNAVQAGVTVALQTSPIEHFTVQDPFNLIVSNPPYIPQSLSNTMHINVTGFEPHLALFVPDDDPLVIYKHIIAFAKQSLSRAGGVFFEIHPPLASQLQVSLSVAGFQAVTILKDINGHNRFVSAIKS